MIAGGVKPGDLVVTAGVQKIDPGMVVRPWEERPMKGINLSEWAVKHPAFVLFLILASGAAGIQAYLGMGRAEDPSFTIKTMVVAAEWPGATSDEVQRQVADPIEEKLQETPYLDYLKTYCLPGRVLIEVVAQGLHAAEGRAGRLVPGPQEDRRHQAHPARGRAGAVHRRRVRGRVLGRVCLHRGRLLPGRAQADRRGRPAAVLAGRGRGQGRPDRRPAGEGVRRVLPQEAGDPRGHPAAGLREPRAAECRHAGRQRGDPDRPGLRPRGRAVRRVREGESGAGPGRRARVPRRRHRRRPAGV